MNRDETGFSVILDEWQYQDHSRSGPETIYWLAMEAGVHQLSDGRYIEAGTMVGDAEGSSLTFAAKFASTPVLLTSVMSNFNSEAVDSSPVTVSATGATVRLESEEARAGQAGKELVGYIAIATGNGTQRIASGVDSTRRNFALSGTFTNLVVLAEEQSAKASDPGSVKIGAISGNQAQLFFEEEQSAALEITHGKEDLGIVGLSAGQMLGVRKGDGSLVSKAVLDQLAAGSPTDAPVVGSTGTITVATTSIGKPVRVSFGSTIENAVIALTGMAATTDEPYTLRVLSRDATGFTFVVDEWEYQDNVRSAAVTVNWIAMSAGVYTLADGRTVEAGTMLADETSGSVRFATNFVDAPVVVTSVMSAIDSTAVDSSPISVSSTGFEARLQTEAARAGFERAQELVGYIAFGRGNNVELLTSGSHFGMSVAFDSPLGKPVVVADTQTMRDTDPQSTMIWTVSSKSVNVFISEEQSLDADRKRSPLDTIGIAAVDAGGLTGTRTGDSTTVTAEALAQATAAGAALVAQQNAQLGAAGKVTVAASKVGQSIRVNYGSTIENAVVVLTGTTASAFDPYTLRVLSRDATGFTFMVDEWEYQDGKRSTSVVVNWVAVAAGVHRLADGRLVEAGTLLADSSSGSATFSADFASGPAVLTSVMSSLDNSAVDSSPTVVTATGFEARLQSEEVRRAVPRSQELVGYIAFGIAGATVRTVEATGTARTIPFGRSYLNAVVVADSQTQFDTDPQTAMLASQSNTGAALFLAEEASLSADTSRSTADMVAMAVFEAGALRGEKLGAAAWVSNAQLAAAAAVPAFQGIGQSGVVSVTATQAKGLIRVDYRAPIENAVVMLTGSYQSGDPYTLRVVSRDANGFTFVIDEWAYQNKLRAKTETIQWVAIAEGTYQMADGRTMQVGTVEADTTAKAVNFASAFATTPVVLTTVMSKTDAKPTDSSPTKVTKTGFTVGLQVEDKGSTTRSKETVGYIAMSAGGTAQTGVTATLGVSSALTTWAPPSSIGQMVVLADTQTRNKASAVVVKLASITTSGVQLLLEREASLSSNLSHPVETVGLIAFLRGTIYGRKL